MPNAARVAATGAAGAGVGAGAAGAVVVVVAPHVYASAAAAMCCKYVCVRVLCGCCVICVCPRQFARRTG